MEKEDSKKFEIHRLEAHPYIKFFQEKGISNSIFYPNLKMWTLTTPCGIVRNFKIK